MNCAAERPCEAAERPYERRTWQQAVYLLRFWALGSRSGDFVMCLHCGSTFAPECLDENSTAAFNELLVEPLAEVADVTGLATGRGVGARTVLPGVERRLSGYSAGRRH